MNVLITGISGFIGTNLVKEFRTSGKWCLYGVSRNSAQLDGLDGLEEVVEQVDASYIDEKRIEFIVHLAGIAHDLSKQYVDEDYFRVNFEKTKKLYDEFLKSSAKKFVFVSSIKAAVDHTDEIVNEEVEPRPATPYGQSKLKAERYIVEQLLPKDKQYYIFRPCMVYGPGNKGNLNLLYQFVKKGIPYPFGAFNNRRSFLYIKNFTFCLQQVLDTTVPSGIYHLSDGRDLSTKELVEIIGGAINKKVPVLSVPVPLITVAARLGSLLGVFFNSHTLNKLTENMRVSNRKIVKIIGEMPYASKDALSETIKTFRT